VEKNFEFKIPGNAPPTIKGEEAGLRWFVHAKLDVPMGRDKNEREDILCIRRHHDFRFSDKRIRTF